MTEYTLLQNALVLSCSPASGETAFDGDILIADDRIAKVIHGRAGVSADTARVVDLRGSIVMPGLADAHTHISWPLDFEFAHGDVAAMPAEDHALETAAVARTYLEHGYTLLIGAGSSKPRLDVAVSSAIERGLIVGPRIVPSGSFLTTVGGMGAETGSVVVGSAAEMQRQVGIQCELGVKAVKLLSSGDGIIPEFPSADTYFSDEIVAAAVKEATRNGAFITAHARSADAVGMAARNGVRIIHHATYLNEAILEELIAVRDSVWVCPGLHYLNAMVRGDAAAFGFTPDKIKLAGYPSELESSIKGYRIMHDNGIRLVSGGDFGHQWTRHGTYTEELVDYVNLIGLTPREALLTATLHAAQAAGLQCGEVREGFLADLIVLGADPSVDISVLRDHSNMSMVIKAGEFSYVRPE